MPDVKKAPRGAFFLGSDLLEIDYCRENSGSQHQYQPLYIVSREETGEVQDQYGDRNHIKQRKQHGSTLSIVVPATIASQPVITFRRL
jgi:hypothetical protein